MHSEWDGTKRKPKRGDGGADGRDAGFACKFQRRQPVHADLNKCDVRDVFASPSIDFKALNDPLVQNLGHKQVVSGFLVRFPAARLVVLSIVRMCWTKLSCLFDVVAQKSCRL